MWSESLVEQLQPWGFTLVRERQVASIHELPRGCPLRNRPGVKKEQDVQSGS
jgi:hypothetical protein